MKAKKIILVMSLFFVIFLLSSCNETQQSIYSDKTENTITDGSVDVCTLSFDVIQKIKVNGVPYCDAVVASGSHSSTSWTYTEYTGSFSTPDVCGGGACGSISNCTSTYEIKCMVSWSNSPSSVQWLGVFGFGNSVNNPTNLHCCLRVDCSLGGSGSDYAFFAPANLSANQTYYYKLLLTHYNDECEACYYEE